MSSYHYREVEQQALTRKHRQFLNKRKSTDKQTRTSKQINEGTDYVPKPLSQAQKLGITGSYGSKAKHSK